MNDKGSARGAVSGDAVGRFGDKHRHNLLLAQLKLLQWSSVSRNAFQRTHTFTKDARADVCDHAPTFLHLTMTFAIKKSPKLQNKVFFRKQKEDQPIQL